MYFLLLLQPSFLSSQQMCLLLSVHSKLKSHGLVAVCPDFPSFTILMQIGKTVLRRKELCFSWLRAHEEKEECFSTGDSTGAKYGNRSYRRSFQEMGLQHPRIPRMESRVQELYTLAMTGLQRLAGSPVSTVPPGLIYTLLKLFLP